MTPNPEVKDTPLFYVEYLKKWYKIETQLQYSTIRNLRPLQRCDFGWSWVTARHCATYCNHWTSYHPP